MHRLAASVGNRFGCSRFTDDSGVISHSPIMHDASPAVKCLLHQQMTYFPLIMTSGTRLRTAREKAGYGSAKEAAEAMGVSVPTYIQHENGTRGIPAARAERYGKFFRIAPEWILYGNNNTVKVIDLGPRLFVIGEVQAGVFKEAWKWARDDWEGFTGRTDLGVPVQQRFGLKVAGDSMDQIYPSGTVLECVEYDGREIPSGKRVIVQRTRVDGSVEATVKEIVRDPEGMTWLVPRSNNPIHIPFRTDQADRPDIESVEIIGIVVGSYRPE